MGLVFEADKDSLEGAFTAAAEAFGNHLAKNHFGEEGMDWTVSGSEMWGGQFAFDFTFRTEAADQPGGEEATFQMQIVGVRNMEPEPFVCAECGTTLLRSDSYEESEWHGGHNVVCIPCFLKLDSGKGECPECDRSFGPNYTGPCDH